VSEGALTVFRDLEKRLDDKENLLELKEYKAAYKIGSTTYAPISANLYAFFDLAMPSMKFLG
jgi:hypothetical protein